MKKQRLYILSLAFLGLIGKANAQCNWTALGPDDTNRIAFGESTYEAIAINPVNNMPYVAFRDGGNFYNASVREWNGTNWVNVGMPGFSYNSECYYESIAVDKFGNPYVACQSKNLTLECAVFKYGAKTPGVWDTVAGQKAAFTVPAQYECIAMDTNGIPYVCYEELTGGDKLIVQKWNPLSSTWGMVGPSLAVSKGQAQYTKIAVNPVNNAPYVAFEDGYHGDKLSVMMYNTLSSSWVPLVAGDTTLTTDTVNYVSLSISKTGNVYVGYEDFGHAQYLGMMEYNGTSWAADTVGVGGNLGGPVNYVSISADGLGNVYASYQDMSYYGYDGLSIAEYSSGSWDFVKSYKVSQSISVKDAIYTGCAVDGNNAPYVAFEDKGNSDKAECFMWNTTNKDWSLLETPGLSGGNPGTWNGEASYTSIAINPTTQMPYVAYRDGNTSDKASVMSYNGTTWSSVGIAGFSAGGAKYTNMNFDATGDPICVYSDKSAAPSYGVTAMKFSGGTWSALGTGSATVSGGNCYYVASTVANDTLWAAYQTSNYHMGVMECPVAGGTWTAVGGDVTGDTAAYQSIAVDKNGVIYVSFQDAPSQALGVSIYKFTGGAWSVVGSRNISAGEGVYTSLQIDPVDNMPVVAYSSYSASTEANVEKFNGTTWNYIGAPGFSHDWTSYMSLAVSSKGAYYVAYSDWGNEVQGEGQENCTVEKFDPISDTAWRTLPGTPTPGTCSNSGAAYQSIALDNSGNAYVAFAAYSAYAKELNCPTGIDEINGGGKGSAKLYPNPNHGSFTVELQNAATEKSYLTVYNVLGEKVYQGTLSADKTEINLGSQATGMYLYRILDENGKVISTGKLMIQ